MKRILLSVACLAAGVAQAQVKWDLPTGYAANTFQTQNNQQFAKEVDELTGGKLKITLHPGGSLYKANEIKRAVQTGQVPAAEFILSGAANENALHGEDSATFLARPSRHRRTLPEPRCAPTTRPPRALRSCSRPSR